MWGSDEKWPSVASLLRQVNQLVSASNPVPIPLGNRIACDAYPGLEWSKPNLFCAWTYLGPP